MFYIITIFILFSFSEGKNYIFSYELQSSISAKILFSKEKLKFKPFYYFKYSFIYFSYFSFIFPSICFFTKPLKSLDTFFKLIRLLSLNYFKRIYLKVYSFTFFYFLFSKFKIIFFF
jgi:hypothetical protein